MQLWSYLFTCSPASWRLALAILSCRFFKSFVYFSHLLCLCVMTTFCLMWCLIWSSIDSVTLLSLLSAFAASKSVTIWSCSFTASPNLPFFSNLSASLTKKWALFSGVSSSMDLETHGSLANGSCSVWRWCYAAGGAAATLPRQKRRRGTGGLDRSAARAAVCFLYAFLLSYHYKVIFWR